MTQSSAQTVLRHDSGAGELDHDDVSVVPLPHSRPQSGTSTSHRISRDEMNLAEFPLTVLSKRVDPSVKTLEFTDSVKGKNGELVNRAWIITGADKFGLPTSSDDEVLLGLLKLTADDGIRDRKVYFTRYELLKILRWTTEGRSYSRLQNALDRLSGVRIKATNAFYDNDAKLHSTKNFGIIDEYEINDGRDTRPSFFTWSEVLFKSFQVGFIKKLDLDFYLDLRSAVSKRLYRYLDKHFWYRSKIQVNLFTLAHEKIGISRNYVYASSLRQQLEPALEELVQHGMLSQFEFVGKGKSTELILIAAQGARREARERVGGTDGESQDSKQNTLLGQSNTTSSTASPTGSHNDSQIAENSIATDDGLVGALIEQLVARGIVERQARRVIAGRTSEELERITSILTHYDGLLQAKSHLVSKNPCGFLYRAVERPFAFMLPGDKRTPRQGEQTNFDLQQRSAPIQSAAIRTTSAPSPHRESKREGEKSDRAVLEERYFEECAKAVSAARSALSDEQLQALRAEAETGLLKLKTIISPNRYREAIEHSIDERVLKQIEFPSFTRWARSAGAC